MELSAVKFFIDLIGISFSETHKQPLKEFCALHTVYNSGTASNVDQTDRARYNSLCGFLLKCRFLLHGDQYFLPTQSLQFLVLGSKLWNLLNSSLNLTPVVCCNFIPM